MVSFLDTFRKEAHMTIKEKLKLMEEIKRKNAEKVQEYLAAQKQG